MGSRRDARTAFVDAHVGGRLRERRILLGMSQTKLGELLGLSFQQIQKYERGIDRISVGRLVHLAQVLGVPITYFFEDLEDLEPPANMPMPSWGKRGSKSRPKTEDPMAKRETLELVRAYYGIEDQQLRKNIYALIRSISSRT